MNIFLDNVNLASTSGPNYFAQKLRSHINKSGHSCEPTPSSETDVQLSFIESHRRYSADIPLVQRLDGIYYNSSDSCHIKNQNIERTYNDADGVIFQTNFNKELVFSFFGPRDNYAIINNGADLEMIESIEPSNHKIFKDHENVWACAAQWRPVKRLRENINYFLQNSGDDDCLVVAGQDADIKINHPRIFYTGQVNIPTLLSIFKASKYFVHLAWIDHCPNVVVDARVCGCEIICSSTGGTREIAGPNATVIQEEEWDLKPLSFVMPPGMDLSKKFQNNIDSDLDMRYSANKYIDFLTKITEKKNG